MRRILFLLLSTALACHGSTPREAVDSLDAAQIQKALDALNTHFVEADSLEEASRPALLEGLLGRIAPGAELVEENAVVDEQKPFPFLAEILDGKVGYIRPGALDAATLTQMDSSLANFSEKGVGALVLDLRGIPSVAGYDTCAKFAQRFAPKGAVLFTIEKPGAKQERIVTSDGLPVYQGLLVVLVDSQTRNAAEVLAASLRETAKAMVVGEATAGEAVEFSDFPLGGGRSLRVAVSRVSLPAGGALFPKGVQPDIPVRLDVESRDRIFELASKEGVGRFTLDPAPPRMNEAALVANTNPEIGGEATSSASPTLRDSVLQRALDLVTAIEFFKK
jgi:hypothetical protein